MATCPCPWFFGRRAFPFKNLILIRQLSVFSNLLLHQICCWLILVYLFLACDASVYAPWHITKASEEARSAEYVSTAAQKASGLISSGTSTWAARSEDSSLAWPHEPSLLLPEVHPAKAALAVGTGMKSTREDTVPPPSLQILHSHSLCCSLFSRDFGTPPRILVFETVPFGN